MGEYCSLLRGHLLDIDFDMSIFMIFGFSMASGFRVLRCEAGLVKHLAKA
jgi:hypothetical protein